MPPRHRLRPQLAARSIIPEIIAAGPSVYLPMHGASLWDVMGNYAPTWNTTPKRSIARSGRLDAIRAEASCRASEAAHNNALNSTAQTWCAWMYHEDWGATVGSAFHRGPNASSFNVRVTHWSYYGTTGVWNVGWFSVTSDRALNTGYVMPNGKWTFCSASYAAGSQLAFANGVQVASAAGSGNLNTPVGNAQRLFIHAAPTDNSATAFLDAGSAAAPFGMMHLAMFPRALSAAEHARLYAPML